MRKIKFRAWDKIAGIMRYELNLYNVSLIANSTSNHIFMQFSGLFDSKGDEIYEGDIIEYSPTLEHILCLVEISDGNLWLLTLPDRQRVNCLTKGLIEKYRLIVNGNIYENSDEQRSKYGEQEVEEETDSGGQGGKL